MLSLIEEFAPDTSAWVLVFLAAIILSIVLALWVFSALEFRRLRKREIDNVKIGRVRVGDYWKSMGYCVALSLILLQIVILLDYTFIGRLFENFDINLSVISIVGFGITLALSPLAFLLFLEGECPFCKVKLFKFEAEKAFDCEACKNRILVRDKCFIKAPKE